MTLKPTSWHSKGLYGMKGGLCKTGPGYWLLSLLVKLLNTAHCAWKSLQTGSSASKDRGLQWLSMLKMRTLLLRPPPRRAMQQGHHEPNNNSMHTISQCTPFQLLSPLETMTPLPRPALKVSSLLLLIPSCLCINRSARRGILGWFREDDCRNLDEARGWWSTGSPSISATPHGVPPHLHQLVVLPWSPHCSTQRWKL